MNDIVSAPPPHSRTMIAKQLLIALLYAGIASFFLHLFAANGMVSIVWPPSGLAVAVLLLWGPRYAAAIWLGACAANFIASGSLPMAAAIAAGNTLEALAIHWLLRRDPGFDARLIRLGDFLHLIFPAAVVGSAVAAVNGASVLLLAGVIPSEGWLLNLQHWWMGDLLGIDLLTPLLLTWRHAPARPDRQSLLEAILLAMLVLLFGQFIFLGWHHPFLAPLARGHWMFLLAIWAAVRFGRHGVSLLLATVAVQGLIGTYLNVGFFAASEMEFRLSSYWGYMLVLTIVTMTLAIYIEAQQRTERKLIQSEDNLNRAQTVGTIGSWALDVRRNVLTWSAECYRIFGIPQGTALSYETFLDCVHPDDRAYVHERWSAALNDEPYDIEHRILVHGETRWVNERADLHFGPDGQLIGGVGITQDVTERRRIQHELAEYQQQLEIRVAERTRELSLSEQRNRLILEATADGIFGTDMEGLFTFVNPAACRLLGYRPEQLLGQPVHLTIHYQRPDGSHFPEMECPQRQTLLSGRPVRLRDDLYWRADGQPLPISVAGEPMFDDNGQQIGSVVSFTDISDRKRAEAALQASLAEAKRLARIKGEFLANMSHEIRTPLNAILGLTHIGLREQPGGKAEELYRRIFDAGEHLLAIVNDVLDFSRIEAGKMVLESQPFSLAALLDQLRSLFGDSARSKGLPLGLSLTPDVPAWVLGDPLRVRQILLNLLGNALKFTAKGEISLAISRQGGQISFAVRDSGVGMQPQQIERLFHAFEQADGSTTREFGGSGLGLTISQQLAQLMGGKIMVYSTPGQGSTFTLQLPLPACQPPESRSASLETQQKPLQGLSILAAEDVAVNRMILAELLEYDGARLTFAENGQQAVDLVRSQGADAFHVVLMDIQMPVMDGLEAARQLKLLAPGLPIIGLSAHALADERAASLAAGMVEHVTKPIDPDTLIGAILRHAATGGIAPVQGS